MEFLSGDCHRILPMRSQHWFRWWLGAIRQQAIIGTNVDPHLCHHMVSIDHNELTGMATPRGAWTSNELQRLDFKTEQWDNSFSIGHQGDIHHQIFRNSRQDLCIQNIQKISKELGQYHGCWCPGMQRARASAALIFTYFFRYSGLSTKHPGSEADPAQHLFPGDYLSNVFMGDLSDPQINQMDKHLIINAAIKRLTLAEAI